MALILWTDQAIADLENIADYISKDSSRYASIVIDNIIKSASLLEEQPMLGRIVPEFEIDSIREIIIGKYRIVYSLVSPERIDILTIHHSSRLLK